jgi:hypothetical protein
MVFSMVWIILFSMASSKFAIIVTAAIWYFSWDDKEAVSNDDG